MQKKYLTLLVAEGLFAVLTILIAIFFAVYLFLYVEFENYGIFLGPIMLFFTGSFSLFFVIRAYKLYPQKDNWAKFAFIVIRRTLFFLNITLDLMIAALFLGFIK